MTRDDGARAFNALMAELDQPMYVVTAAVDGEQAGCLVGFASQSSIDPPRFTVWLSIANRTERLAARASTLVVHVLRPSDHGLAALFGSVPGDELDKFGAVSWEPGPGGAPVLAGCDWFAGDVVERNGAGGDHIAYMIRPTSGVHRRGGAGMLGYQATKDLPAGHPVP